MIEAGAGGRGQGWLGAQRVSPSTWAHALSEFKGSLFMAVVWIVVTRASDPGWVAKAITATVLYFAAHFGARVMRMKAGEELP